MKRSILVVVALATALVVSIGLFGCGDGSPPVTVDGSKTTSPTASQTTTAPPVKSLSATDFPGLITAADVEAVSGLSGLRTVESGTKVTLEGTDTPQPTAGDITFVQGKKGLLMVNFGNRAWFDEMKKTPNYRDDVTGVGDGAFTGPSKMISPKVTYQFAFTKGDTAVIFTTFLGKDGKPLLTEAQLKALAERIAPRAK